MGEGEFPPRAVREAGLKRRRVLEKQSAFCRELAEGWSITKAAKLAGVATATVRKWRAEDSDFAEAWDEAIEAGTDRIEDKVTEKALAMDDGNAMRGAEMMLKARRPAKYRERHEVQHNHKLLLSDVMEQLGVLPGSVIEGEVVDHSGDDDGEDGEDGLSDR